MEVIVAWVIKNVALKETFSITSNLSITDKIYKQHTTILGVYSSADAARNAMDKERGNILKMYGAKALDDENTEDKHTFFTFGCGVYECEVERPYGKWLISEVQCPYCFEFFDTDAYDEGDLEKCPCCGKDMERGGKEK